MVAIFHFLLRAINRLCRRTSSSRVAIRIAYHMNQILPASRRRGYDLQTPPIAQDDCVKGDGILVRRREVGICERHSAVQF